MITDFISIVDNSLLQGLSYGIAVIGLAISFRILRYPDLTADGSFLVGAAGFAALLNAGIPWPAAVLCSAILGAAAGTVTAVLHTKIGVNRLLSGILTSMICYSAAFRILSGRPNLSLGGFATMFTFAETIDAQSRWRELDFHAATIVVSGLIALTLILLLYGLLISELGIVLRATGQNAMLVEEIGRRPQRYHTFGLALGNAIIGFSGGLVAARQGFVDVGMGIGIIINLVAALVLGETLMRVVRLHPATSLMGRMLAPVVGGCLYYMLYVTILRASIREWIPIKIMPTDLKFLAALVVIVVVAIHIWSSRRATDQEEVLPL